MATVIEHTEGHYEVREMPYGRDYAWCPECVIVECDCGRRVDLTASATGCWCGADHTSIVREELSTCRRSNEDLHPWRDEYHQWHRDESPCSEYQDWQELRALE